MKKIFAIIGLLALAACGGAPKELQGQQVFFAFDSAEISDAARKNLEAQALYMKKHPETQITLQGRCDERGSTEYNLALGALRAGNAAHVMTRNGIEPERIKTVSYGKENPLYPGTGEEVWALNRNATTKVRQPK
ncbi:MAG: OmpA family protein [Alphaproteobacteria bacterium]|nr:OmpA family protein [Alphaproteobacteria bacterium]